MRDYLQAAARQLLRRLKAPPSLSWLGSLRALPEEGRSDLRSAPASLKTIPPARAEAPALEVEKDSNDPLAARAFAAAGLGLVEKTKPEPHTLQSTALVLASNEASACSDLLRLLSLKLYRAIEGI